MNKEKMRVQSILNVRRSSQSHEEPVEIFSCKDWVNSDDMTLNRVVISYDPTLQIVNITIS